MGIFDFVRVIVPVVTRGVVEVGGRLPGLFNAAEGEDQPVTAEQVEAAKAGKAALDQASATEEAPPGAEAAFIGNVLFPGFGSIFDLVLSGASQSAIAAQLAPLVNQSQDYAQENNIPVEGESKPPSPDEAKTPTDLALYQIYMFTQTLAA